MTIILTKWLKYKTNKKKIDFHNLTYIFKGKTAPTIFLGFKGPLHIFKSIYSGDIALEDVEKDQKNFKAELGCVKQGDPKDKSKEQFEVINNVINLYESREKVVQIFNNYPREKSRRIYESKQGKGRKILTPKQMLQRLPIALVQIKAGNNSEIY